MDELELNSRGYILVNAETGRVLASDAADVPVPVASLTKMMTALLTIRARQLDEVVEITPDMLLGLEEFAILGLQVGQKLTVEELLYATMLPSAGDAAQALAISTSSDLSTFVEMMNATAADLGLKNTHFSNVVGFDEENYSTPRDMATLLRTALLDPTFVRFFESFEAYLPSVDRTIYKTFAAQPYIKGGKTGYTDAAGRCLASAAEVEGAEYILVTVGAEPGENVNDANRAYNYLAENYEPVTLVADGEVFARVPVTESATKFLEFRATEDLVMVLPNGSKAEDLTVKIEDLKGQPLEAIERNTGTGEPFGSWTLYYQDEEIYGWGLTIQETCQDESAGRGCVEKPKFYSYGWMALGVIVTFCLVIMTAREFWKVRRDSTKRVTPWIGLVMTMVSLATCGFVFWDCFASTLEIEQIQPTIEITTPGSTESTKPEGTPGIQADETAAELVSRGLGNCTTGFGNLMLINPNFSVDTNFIEARRQQLISVSQTYGIEEYHPQGNGDNMMIPEAAEHLNEMLAAYSAANPGHEMGTYSCFRSRGTSCGRLCAATGESDHHTGLTCDLIDLAYGSELDSDDYKDHVEWQWLRENSYRYGFIDRFPEAWAGGSMLEPLNVDENGSTGLFETWHYRYVGVEAATEIATGKYNNGEYDSLEHYLKMRGVIVDLKNGICS